MESTYLSLEFYPQFTAYETKAREVSFAESWLGIMQSRGLRTTQSVLLCTENNERRTNLFSQWLLHVIWRNFWCPQPVLDIALLFY